MRAVKFVDRQVVVEDMPSPRGEGVLVNVRACGICGSDTTMLDMGYSIFGIPGHEISGQLEDGTPVAIEPLEPCGSCEYCATGDTQVCMKGEVDNLRSGTRRRNGRADPRAGFESRGAASESGCHDSVSCGAPGRRGAWRAPRRNRRLDSRARDRRGDAWSLRCCCGARRRGRSRSRRATSRATRCRPPVGRAGDRVCGRQRLWW